MADIIDQIPESPVVEGASVSEKLASDSFPTEKSRAAQIEIPKESQSAHLPGVEIVDAAAAEKTSVAVNQAEQTNPEARSASLASTQKIEKASEDIHSALNGLWRSDSDYEKVNKMLQGMSDKEREELKRVYKEKYGLELGDEFKDRAKDAQQDKAYNLLNRKEGHADDAGRIHTALVERKQWIEGRSDANCEKDIRDTISTMNSEQIAQLDKIYFDRYKVHLREALINDEKLSQNTKDYLEVYLKGTDKRTTEDTLSLADKALKDKDIEKFGEVMRGASPEARKKFMENDGDKRMKEAFEGHWYNALPYLVPLIPASAGKGSDSNVTDKELKRAQDIARDGHMSTANKIRENTGVVSNSDKAIELAIEEMSKEERAAFVRGKKLVASNADESKLSEEDKKAVKTYKEIHQSIEDSAPVDSAKKAKWEDLIEHKGGSLVGKISTHHGVIYNDSKGDVTKEIENMSKADWEYAKSHPEYRAEVLKALTDLKGARVDQSDIDSAMKLYDQKIAAKSYEESKNTGTRSLAEKLEDDTHWYKNDRKSMVEALTHMTKDEQQKYRTDAEYRKKIDALVADKIADDPAGVAAKHILEKVAKGQSPEADLIVKMNMRAQETQETKTMTTAGLAVLGGPVLAPSVLGDAILNDGKIHQASMDAAFGSHSASPIRDMEEEFKKNPALREKILNPKSEEEKKFAQEFERSARLAMGDADYDRYAKPLIQTGKVPMELRMQLDKGVISNDKDGTFKDILNATPEERQKILKDKDYQEKVLGYLSDDDRKVALSILEQGKAQPEDNIRAKLNHWGGSAEIMSTLRELKDNPQEIERLKEQYAKKYGHDLTADLIDKLSGAEKIEAENILKRQATTAREAYNDARDQVYDSYDGVGKAFVNNVWDGTGHMTEDNLNQFSAKMSEFSSKFKELPLAQQKELSERLHKSLDAFIESKGAAADAVVDVVIAVAAVAGAVFTDGISLSLLLATGAGGAALKVLVNSVIMGSDYDWSAKGVGKDAAIGFVNGFVSMLGPGEVGGLLKVGETAAKAATKQALKEGAEVLVKKGAQEILERELQTAVKHAIVNGSYEVPEKALQKIVAQTAKEGASDAEKAALKASLKKALQENLDKDAQGLLKRLATEYGFNMAGGALGGGTANALGATMEWDNSKSISDNMARIGKAAAMGAVFGAAGAAAFTTVFKVGGSMYHGLVESFKLKPGEKLNAQQLDKLAKETGVKDAKFHYNENGDLVLEGTVPDRSAILPTEPDRHAILPPEPDRNAVVPPEPKPPVIEGQPIRVIDGQNKPSVDPHGDTIVPPEPGTHEPRGGDANNSRRIDDDLEGPKTEVDPINAPQTQRILNDVPPEVQKVLDRADIPPEERFAVMQRIRQNEMAKPDAIRNFAKEGTEIVNGWDDASQLFHRAHANEPRLLAAQTDFAHNVADRLLDDLVRSGMSKTDAFMLINNPPKLSKLTMHEGPVKDFFRKNPSDLAKLDQLTNAFEVRSKYSKAIADRTAELQSMMDKFAQENGLPKARIILAEAGDLGNAKGLYHDGIVRLNALEALSAKDPASLLDTLYHEFVHNQQDSLIIRKFIDQFEASMGPGYKLHQPPTPYELEAIRALYKQRGLGGVSDQHLGDVIAARGGRELTQEQGKIAEALMKDWSRGDLPSYHRYWDNINFIDQELANISEHSGVAKILDRLAKDTDGKWSQSLFGTNPPPAEVQAIISRLKNGSGVDTIDAHQALRRAIVKNRQQLMEMQQALYKDYISSAQETEAFVLGTTAKVESQKELHGASTDRPGRTTLIQGSANDAHLANSGTDAPAPVQNTSSETSVPFEPVKPPVVPFNQAGRTTIPGLQPRVPRPTFPALGVDRPTIPSAASDEAPPPSTRREGSGAKDDELPPTRPEGAGKKEDELPPTRRDGSGSAFAPIDMSPPANEFPDFATLLAMFEEPGRPAAR